MSSISVSLSHHGHPGFCQFLQPCDARARGVREMAGWSGRSLRRWRCRRAFGSSVFVFTAHHHDESQATQLLEVRIATSDMEAQAGAPKRGTCAFQDLQPPGWDADSQACKHGEPSLWLQAPRLRSAFKCCQFLIGESLSMMFAVEWPWGMVEVRGCVCLLTSRS